MKTYTLDPGTFSLRRFFDLTRDRRMLPGRVILQKNMEESFALLTASGINNLADLLRVLGSQEKIERFSIQSGMDSPYLVLLKREAGSYLARPFPLSSFPGIPFEYTELLKSRGIRNTRDFFEQTQTVSQRKEMTKITGIPEARLKELYVLCDLSRICGVGGSMARLVYEAGIRSPREFSVTRERFSENLSDDDISYCMDYARVIVELEREAE